jgi:hypothetical protein
VAGELVGTAQLLEDDRCDVFAMAVQRLRGGVEPARARLKPAGARGTGVAVLEY